MNEYEMHINELIFRKHAAIAVREEGRGIGEHERNIEIARRLTKEGQPAAKVAAITGLSVEEIKSGKFTPHRQSRISPAVIKRFDQAITYALETGINAGIEKVARRMKARNMSIEQIARLTLLLPDQIAML